MNANITNEIRQYNTYRIVLSMQQSGILIVSVGIYGFIKPVNICDIVLVDIFMLTIILNHHNDTFSFFLSINIIK